MNFPVIIQCRPSVCHAVEWSCLLIKRMCATINSGLSQLQICNIDSNA